MKKLNEKTVLITGGSRGIGFATASLFAMDQYNVAICARNEVELRQAREKIIKKTGNDNILALVGDVSQEVFVKELFLQTHEVFKSIDVCVNNAGCLMLKPFFQTMLDDWNYVINSNQTSAFLCCKEAFHYMQDPNINSVIVNVSSLSGIRGVEKFPGMAAYIASKYAVVGLTESLAVEGKPFNISVNCIAPGAVNTRMLSEQFTSMLTATKPEEVANIIKFLATKNGDTMINGTIFEYFCN